MDRQRGAAPGAAPHPTAAGARRAGVRRWLRRLAGAGVAAAAALLLLPGTAEAHALVVRSDPAAGASLAQVPRNVTVTFSEVPEPRGSSLQVVDASGNVVSRGPTRQVPDNAFQLQISLDPLLNGVYTVRWKTISADDGHSSSGTFTFGVGPSAYAASTAPAPALVAPSNTSTAPVVAGHWVFYVGLGLLVGGAWVSLFALSGVSRRLLVVTLGGALVMLAGLVAYTIAQALANGTPLEDVPSTSLGLDLAAQAVPGLAAAACVEVALVGRGRVRTGALLAATVLAGVTVLVHVLTTHAASSRSPLLEMAAQWGHLAAFAAWIGGLAALLIALGSEPSPAKAAAVRRFSQVAAVTLVVVGVTGLLRAVDEVAVWSALTNTLFGQLVVLKVGLLLLLALLGGWNRFRSVPAVERSLRGLRRVGRLEIGVAGATLVASATLTSLVPPALQQAAVKQPAPAHVTAQALVAAPVGAAARSSLKGSLDVSPGYPGPNRFVLRAYRATTSKTLTGVVILRFEMPSRPDLPPTELPLSRAADGSYVGVGNNIILIGGWTVTAVVQDQGTSVDLPFQVTCNPSPQQLHLMTMGTVPMIYGLKLANGIWQLQAYITPGRVGRNTLHLAYTDLRNGPVDVTAVPTVTVTQGGVKKTVSLIRLAFGTPTANQFYGTVNLAAGQWTFHVTTAMPDGGTAQSTFSLNVGK